MGVIRNASTSLCANSSKVSARRVLRDRRLDNLETLRLMESAYTAAGVEVN